MGRHKDGRRLSGISSCSASLQTGRTRGYADEPVKKSNRDYTRALAGPMRTPSGVAAKSAYHGGRNGRYGPDKLASMYTKFSRPKRL